MYYMDPGYEVALTLMGKDPENDKDFEESEELVDEFLFKKYGISDPTLFENLLRDLASMADRGKSPLTGEIYCGFANREKQVWLFKISQ